MAKTNGKNGQNGHAFTPSLHHHSVAGSMRWQSSVSVSYASESEGLSHERAGDEHETNARDEHIISGNRSCPVPLYLISLFATSVDIASTPSLTKIMPDSLPDSFSRVCCHHPHQVMVFLQGFLHSSPLVV